jgi:hypothetical protein
VRMIGAPMGRFDAAALVARLGISVDDVRNT